MQKGKINYDIILFICILIAKRFNNSYSIVAKNSDYWTNLCYKANKGILEQHAINLRLAHLKNAVNQNCITYETYYAHRKRITSQYSKTCRGYEPCTLMDFGKTLTTYDSVGELEINQLFKINQYSKNINHQNNIIVNINDYYPDKSNCQNNIPRKSRKRCKKKKKCKDINHDYSNNTKAELNEHIEIQYNNKIENCISKNSVKIFERQINKHQTIETNSKELQVSTKKSIKDVFSEILKQYKKKKELN